MANTSPIAEMAKKLAWPKGTSSSKYKYPSGAPTSAFKQAKANTYGSSYGWSTASKKGASCDMFVGVCVRASGYDKRWPAGLNKALAHAKSSSKWKEVKYNYNVSDLRPGDVMFSHHKKSTRHPNWGNDKAHHIFLYVGNGDISQASAQSKYGYTSAMSISSQKSKETWVRVFRPTNSNYSGTDTNSGTVSTPAPTTQTIIKTVSGADAILKACDELAWPLGTASSKWKSPTPALKKWLDATLPNRKWGRKYGASCDKAVFCAIRKSGYDNSVKRNLEDQIKPSKWNTSKWQLVQGGKNTKLDRSKFQAGDVIITDRPGSGGHIYIIYKNGGRSDQIIAEGSYSRKNHLHLVKSKGELHNPPGNLGNWHWRPITTTTTTVTTGGSVYAGGAEGGLDDGRALVLEKSISQLYSTDNYKWVETEKEESEESKRLKQYQQSLKDFLSNIKIEDSRTNVAPVDVNVSYSAIKSSKQSIFKLDKLKSASSTQSLISYPSLVEAPVIELSFNGITIGGYGNSGDKYPNYISSMSVKKINGRINTYTINLVYQVRAGEDPNFIDKLISNTGYLKPLKIIYGDANSSGTIFKEESAVITDVKSQDSVSSSQINYTISAISSVTSADKTYYSFNAKTDKPSNIINNLLYNSGEISTQLQTAFPKMADKNFVVSNNLIPNNDSVVTVGGMADVSPLTYLTHVVSCMVNVANNTSYFLTFNDSKNGAYFNIAEVAPVMDSNVLYEVDVGYPGDNFVTNFQLCDNIYWPLVYEYNGSISKWEYDIDNYGNINRYQTNSLHTDNKYLASSIINSNWWKSLTEFPISAKLTLKGLTIPVMLMTYIRVNTLFYGQKDIASGIYVVTDQEDSISGNGYSTTLTLLRVSD